MKNKFNKDNKFLTKFLLSNDKSFKLVRAQKPKIKSKFSIKKKKPVSEELQIIGFENETKKTHKIKKFFTEPSFNMLEMLITLVIVCSLVAFVVIYIKNKEIDLNNTESLNGYESITDEKLVEFIDLYKDIN